MVLANSKGSILTKKFLVLQMFVASSVALASQIALAEYCLGVGRTTSTPSSCMIIYSSCGGGKLSAGEQCNTHHYSCDATARAQLAFPFSNMGEWQYTGTTSTYTPIALENECPVE
jgi:hypothetical protein